MIKIEPVKRKVRSTRDAINLLLKGYILKYGNYYKLKDSVYDLILLRSDGNNHVVNWKQDAAMNFQTLCQYCDDQIYREIETNTWYDDIPKTGVLCKVADVKENLSVYNLAIISGYQPCNDKPFISIQKNITEHGNMKSFKFAVPLSFDEIQKYTL